MFVSPMDPKCVQINDILHFAPWLERIEQHPEILGRDFLFPLQKKAPNLARAHFWARPGVGSGWGLGTNAKICTLGERTPKLTSLCWPVARSKAN